MIQCIINNESLLVKLRFSSKPPYVVLIQIKDGEKQVKLGIDAFFDADLIDEKVYN